MQIGISPCPNDVFIFSALILGRIESSLEFRYEDVETLNKLAIDGALDVAKISYGAYPLLEQQYLLLNCGGALGRGVGPLLLTHGAAFDKGRETWVPGEHTTANLLFSFFAGDAPRAFLPFDQLYRRLRREHGSQGVVIHENRFTYQRDGLTLVQDLGEHWERETGFPIPLGAIALSRNLSSEQIGLEDLIRSSLRWAQENRQEALALCREHAQEMSDEVMEAHIDLYVNDFTYDVGAEGEAAVEHLMSVAKHRAGG